MTRLDAFRKNINEKGIDSAVILDELNQHYLCGFAFTDGLLLITPVRAFLITDFRYLEMAKNSAFPCFEVVTPKNRVEFITEVLKADGSSVVGFEGGFVPYEVYKKYTNDYSFVRFEDIENTIESLRMLKYDEEIEKMQKAQDITDKAFSHILNVLDPSMTEIEVAAELEYVMRRNGASGFAFDTIAVSGDASSLPHGTPRNVKLKKGFLTLDFGAKYDGYYLVDPAGIAYAGGGFSLNLTDMATFGEMVRNNGKLGRYEILSKQATDEISRGGDPELFAKGGEYPLLKGWSYHNFWWITNNDHKAFMARGVHGQAIYIDPVAEMVIVRFASNPLSSNKYIDPVSIPAYEALADYLMEKKF
jgi:hypothetical protein